MTEEIYVFFDSFGIATDLPVFVNGGQETGNIRRFGNLESLCTAFPDAVILYAAEAEKVIRYDRTARAWFHALTGEPA